MKKILILIITSFCLSTPALAGNTKIMQTIFTPNTTTVIFLNCYNTNKDVIKSYEALKIEMTKKWLEAKNPDINIFFIPNSPFSRQIINIYVGGTQKYDGSLCPLPKSIYITSHYRDNTYQALININNLQGTIMEIEKIIK